MNTVKKNSGIYEKETSSALLNRSARNSSKAEVYIKTREGKKVLFKDYSGRNLLTRIVYGRYTLRREALAYERLKGSVGIPQCYGLEGKDVLAMEYIKGQSLSSFEYGKVSETVFIKLKKTISSMHAMGVVNGDIHRSNVLVTPDGDVYLIDFASALFADGAGTPNSLYDGIKSLDLHAFERMKARYLCLDVPAPKGFFGFCYTVCVTVKKLKRIKRIKRRTARIIRRMF